MGTFRGTRMAKHVILVMLALSFIRVHSSEAGRVLTESNTTLAGRTDMDVTVRVDPLHKLKKYRGGYNVTNDHYWSSAVFTGISGYAIALIWLLCGLGYGILLLVRTDCCKRSRKHKNKSSCHEQYHLQPLLLASFCTLLAITACGLAFGGNSKSHSRAKTVINIILDTADGASGTIFNITGAMKEISRNLQEVDGKTNQLLNTTTIKLDTQASDIKMHATKNRHLIQKGLKMSYALTTVTIALTLLVVISLLALGVSKYQRPLQVLIAVCWMLAVFCWLYFGISFFLQNLTGDTCKALEGFQKNPYNNSLSPILPCQQLLSRPTISPEEDVQLRPSLLLLKVIKQLACPDSQPTCNGGILVPANYYKTIGAYCTSIQLLLDEFTSIEGLVECRPVKDAFSEILNKHCKPLRRYIRLLWSALLFLSLVLVILVLIWTIKAHHDQTHHSSGGSVKPHYGDTIECGATNHTDDDSEDGPEQ